MSDIDGYYNFYLGTGGGGSIIETIVSSIFKGLPGGIITAITFLYTAAILNEKTTVDAMINKQIDILTKDYTNSSSSDRNLYVLSEDNIQRGQGDNDIMTYWNPVLSNSPDYSNYKFVLPGFLLFGNLNVTSYCCSS